MLYSLSLQQVSNTYFSLEKILARIIYTGKISCGNFLRKKEKNYTIFWINSELSIFEYIIFN